MNHETEVTFQGKNLETVKVEKAWGEVQLLGGLGLALGCLVGSFSHPLAPYPLSLHRRESSIEERDRKIDP